MITSDKNDTLQTLMREQLPTFLYLVTMQVI